MTQCSPASQAMYTLTTLSAVRYACHECDKSSFDCCTRLTSSTIIDRAWSRLNGSGLWETLTHSRHCVERYVPKVGHEINTVYSATQASATHTSCTRRTVSKSSSIVNTNMNLTRRSADADNRLDAFSGQSRSTNMVPFHMLHIVSYCAIVTLSLRQYLRQFTIFVFKKFHDLEMGVKGHSRSLRVVSFDRLCMVSY